MMEPMLACLYMLQITFESMLFLPQHEIGKIIRVNLRDKTLITAICEQHMYYAQIVHNQDNCKNKSLPFVLDGIELNKKTFLNSIDQRYVLEVFIIAPAICGCCSLALPSIACNA